MDDRMTLAALRIRAGYSQSDVASLLGISKPTLIKWEADSRLMPISKIEHFRRIYQVSENAIYFGQASVLSHKIKSAYKNHIDKSRTKINVDYSA